jgi:hypothetical protein
MGLHRQRPTDFMHTPASLGIQTMYRYVFIRAVIFRCIYRGLYTLAAGPGLYQF